MKVWIKTEYGNIYCKLPKDEELGYILKEINSGYIIEIGKCVIF